LEPLSHFRDEKIQDTIVFFGSARIAEQGPLGDYYRDARILARLITEWSSQNRSAVSPASSFVPAVVRALWRLPTAARRKRAAKPSGLNIGLPFEQQPNRFITPELSFEFHYFFMRKFWFAYLAKALVIFRADSARWTNCLRC